MSLHLTDKNTNVYYLQNFGCIGNGVTDDTNLIKQAIETIPSGATLVLNATKEYLITDTLVINKPLQIVGEGSFKLGVKNKYLLSLQANDVYVSTNFKNPSLFKCDTVSNSHPNGVSGAIQVRGARCTIEHCTIDSFVNGVVIENDLSYNHNRILFNNIINCLGVSSESTGDGVSVFSTECEVIGNFIEAKLGEDCRVGITLENLTTKHEHSIVKDNVVKGSFRRSIHIEHVKDCKIINNILEGFNWWGIICFSSHNSLLQGNTIKTLETIWNGSEWNAHLCGIFMSGVSTNTIIKNNVINTNNRYDGVHVTNLDTGIDGIDIDGNIILNNKTGIDIIECKNMSITRNTIKNNQSFGLTIYKSKDEVIHNNTIDSNGATGIKLNNTNKASVIGNLVKNNTDEGIFLINATGAVVTNNKCFDDNTTQKQTIGINTYTFENSVLVNNYLKGNKVNNLQTDGSVLGSIIKDNIV